MSTAQRFSPKADLEYRAHQVPQCQELIVAYRAQYQLETITPPPRNKRKHPTSKDGSPPGSDTAPEDGSPLESEPAIRKRPCNTRKHPASKDGYSPGSCRTDRRQSPGSDATPKDGNPPGSYAAPEDGNPLGSDAAPEDGNPLGSDAAPEDGSPLESEPATRKRKPRSGSNKEKKNPKRRKWMVLFAIHTWMMLSAIHT